LKQIDSDDAEAMLPIAKQRKGSQQYVEQNKDEQAISESSLNKIVGAADVYNLQAGLINVNLTVSDIKVKLALARKLPFSCYIV